MAAVDIVENEDWKEFEEKFEIGMTQTIVTEEVLED
jgi:hypothetical protein